MDTLNSPRITAAPGSYEVAWTADGLQIVFAADRIRAHSDGRLQSRVRVIAKTADGEQVLHHGTLNLAAGRSRKELSRNLEERVDRDGLNFDRIVEESCRLILEAEEEGSPTTRLQPVISIDVKYMLGNLVLDGLPVLTFAPGGTLKSYLSLYKALLIENGLDFMGTETPRANTLILDWEVNEAEAARRCTLLANGLQQTNVCADVQLPLYRRCGGPIHSEASEIAKVIHEKNVRYVVIDSAGLACGGDVASSELTIQFFNTLRKVTAATGAAADIQTHTTKADRREENQQRLPIGSIYWENLCRITWELRAEQERPGTYRLGIFPRKCNMGALDPLGLRMTFEHDALVVEPAPVTDVSTEQGATRAFIIDELGRGEGSVGQLVEATGAAAGTVRWHLMKLKQAGKVESVSRGVYRLVEV